MKRLDHTGAGMNRGMTGVYRETVTDGEVVRAFVPDPLPPVPALEITPELQLVHQKALLACGRLDGISTLLPNPALFLYSYVRREAVLSSQIEGTQSSLSDLMLFELSEAYGAPFDDVVEVSNYVAALEHGLARLRGGFPLSGRLIREVHERLLAHGRGENKQPGEYRRSQNWIGGTRPGTATYVPPPPEEIAQCMTALEQFMHDDTVPTLIKAALAHVQFETIHPFLDGNGRTGRLLVALILHNDNILRDPLLYLSLYLKEHRTEYYRLLDAVRYTGDWESWLRFFLEGVATTAAGAVATAHRLLALFANDEARIHRHGAMVGSVTRAFAVVRARPISSIDLVATTAGMSYPTALKCLHILTELGITREITGKKRNRVFAYDEYLAVLSEGAL